MDALQRGDIQRARINTKFDVSIVQSILWHPGRRHLIEHLVKILQAEAVFDKDIRRYMSRNELIEQSYKIQLRLVELRSIHRWDRETFMLAMTLIDDHIPFGLHFSAFIPVLESQGSDEQIAEWLPRCLNLEVLGAYAQTELGMYYDSCSLQVLRTGLQTKHNGLTGDVQDMEVTFKCWRPPQHSTSRTILL